jgi:hypothetical protein
MDNGLEPYIELMNDEYGEFLDLLNQLQRYSEFMTKDFGFMLMDEIQINLMNIKENTRIVEKDEISARRIKVLEWD